MGQILSQPVTDKRTLEGHSKHLTYGVSSMQGWRINMEDAHSSVLDLDAIEVIEDDEETEHDEEKKDISKQQRHEDKSEETQENEKDVPVEESGKPPEECISFFGVYDGHGGEKTAYFTGQNLHRLIKSTESYKNKDYINALKEGFLSCDQAILKDYDMRSDDSGCAATAVVITQKSIYCGNAGDSRTIMSTNGFFKALSFDHKPSNEGEKARICSAGGFVDMGRVNGNLALSRGIGDFEFKKGTDLPPEEQIVTSYPDVVVHNLDFNKDEFVVLACDGIWDCLTSQQCVECIRRGVYERKPLTSICEDIMELCCAPTSDGSGIGCDNMSIIIVALLDGTKNETLDDWYNKIIKKIDKAQSNEKDSVEYGQVSRPYDEIYKNLYGEHYEMGKHANNEPKGSGMGSSLYSMFGPDSHSANSDDEDNEDNTDDIHDDLSMLSNNGAISLQKLLSSNAITNENGVIYLDTSSAQSLLERFGMAGDESDDANAASNLEEEKIEEIENDNPDQDHNSH